MDAETVVRRLARTSIWKSDFWVAFVLAGQSEADTVLSKLCGALAEEPGWVTVTRPEVPDEFSTSLLHKANVSPPVSTLADILWVDVRRCAPRAVPELLFHANDFHHLLRCGMVFSGPPAVKSVFRTASPHLFGVRSGMFEVPKRRTRAAR